MTGFDGITLYLLPVICLFQIFEQNLKCKFKGSQNASCFPLSWFQIMRYYGAMGVVLLRRRSKVVFKAKATF